MSAYNPVFASNCTPENNYCQSDYAYYFKIMTLSGNVRQPPDQVPEPAPVLFLAAALLFTRRVRARRH